LGIQNCPPSGLAVLDFINRTKGQASRHIPLTDAVQD
jgi:hypothetical protein